MTFVDRIQEFQRFCRAAKRPIPRMTVAVTEKYARRALGLPSDAAVIYSGVPLRCIGSKAWRARRWAEQNEGIGKSPSHTSTEHQVSSTGEVK